MHTNNPYPFPPGFAPMPPAPCPPPPSRHPDLWGDSDGYSRKEVDDIVARILARATTYTDESVTDAREAAQSAAESAAAAALSISGIEDSVSEFESGANVEIAAISGVAASAATQASEAVATASGAEATAASANETAEAAYNRVSSAATMLGYFVIMDNNLYYLKGNSSVYPWRWSIYIGQTEYTYYSPDGPSGSAQYPAYVWGWTTTAPGLLFPAAGGSIVAQSSIVIQDNSMYQFDSRLPPPSSGNRWDVSQKTPIATNVITYKQALNNVPWLFGNKINNGTNQLNWGSNANYRVKICEVGPEYAS